MEIALAVYIGLLGLALGSFVNALVYRVYMAEFAPKKKRRKLSVLHGRSECPECHHTLAAKDLVPVFSWLQLRGKCRYCKKPISAQYPLVEVVTALSLAVSFVLWPQALTDLEIVRFALWAVIVTLCVALIITDIRWMLLPNKIVYPLIAVAAVFRFTVPGAFGGSALLQTLGAAVIVGGLFHILYTVSSGRWIGGGDVPLGYALGLIVGDPLRALLVLFLSSVLALAAFMALTVATRDNRTIIAYGPFLIIAMALIVLGDPYVTLFTDVFSLS